MSKQPIEVKSGEDPANRDLFLKIEADVTRIRENAYFRWLSQNADDVLDNWLRAEQEVFEVPASTLADIEQSYTMKLALPGVQASQITVAADSHSVTVRATAPPGANQRELFRHFEFAANVDLQNARAYLQNGVLDIFLPKAGALRPKSSGHAA